MWFSPSGPYKYGDTASAVLLYPATQISATNPYRIGPGLSEDLSSPSYKRALEFEAMGCVAEDNPASSAQTGLLPNDSVLPTHPFIAEVPPSSVLQHLVPQPRGLGFSSAVCIEKHMVGLAQRGPERVK